MDVRCERCRYEYSVDEARVPEVGLAVACGGCGHVFLLRKKTLAVSVPLKPGEPAAGIPLSSLAAASSPQAATGQAPAPARTEAPPRPEFRLRQPGGKIFPFKELTTLQRWIVERKASRADEVAARDEEEWRQLGDVPELASFFDVVDAADRAADRAALQARAATQGEPANVRAPAPQGAPARTPPPQPFAPPVAVPVPAGEAAAEPAWATSPEVRPGRRTPAAPRLEPRSASRPARSRWPWVLGGLAAIAGAAAGAWYGFAPAEQKSAATSVAPQTPTALQPSTPPPGQPQAPAARPAQEQHPAPPRPPEGSTGPAEAVAAVAAGSGDGPTGPEAQPGKGAAGNEAPAGSPSGPPSPPGPAESQAAAAQPPPGAPEAQPAPPVKVSPAEEAPAAGGVRPPVEITAAAEPPAPKAVPRPAPPPADKGTRALLQRARQLRDGHRCEAALGVYAQVLAADPKSAPAHAGRGVCYLELSRYDQAEASFRAALETDPRNAEGLYGMAETCRYMGRTAEAVEHYERFLEVRPAGEDAAAARKLIHQLKE